MERVCLSEKCQAQVPFLEICCPCPWSGSVQLQVIHVVLDPGFTGVGTDVSALFGLESVEQEVDRLQSHGMLSVIDISLCSCWTVLVGERTLLG